MHRALTTAHIPSRLEPASVLHSDGKWPDGISVVPWQRGKLLVWDATCSDTFAPSYIARSGAGLVAAEVEGRKRVRYSNLAQTHHFVPIAIETSGVFGPATAVFIKELGHRLRRVTGDDLSHHHLVHGCLWPYRGGIVHQFWGLPGAETLHAFLLYLLYFCFSYSL